MLVKDFSHTCHNKIFISAFFWVFESILNLHIPWSQNRSIELDKYIFD